MVGNARRRESIGCEYDILAAFISTVVAAMNRCPLWVPVLILCVIELIRVLP